MYELRRIDLRGMRLDRATLRRHLPRAQETGQAAAQAVRGTLDRVAAEGRAAVLDFTERFDGVRPSALRVAGQHIEAAVAGLDPAIRSALRESIRRARIVAEADRRTAVTSELGPDSTVTTRWLPVDRVGLYVPGGLAVYPSTVVMNVVPAQAAGVGSLAIASPPQADTGLPHPTVLAAAGLLGVDEVWAIGGAQAIAALTYGFSDGEELEPVDLITGPGNAYVAAAKAQVQGTVGIDAVAGPTEIIVFADSTADPRYVAADMISQAEHDPNAAAVLVTAEESVAAAVSAHIAEQAPAARHADRIAQALAGSQSAIVLTDDREAALTVLNAYAGEHVELQVADAAAAAVALRNGGSVFIGPYSPVALGDYCSGSNHVLPTMGTAAFSSALGVQSFLKGSQIIDYSRAGLEQVAAGIEALAEAENLPAHGRAVSIRFA
ncbi:histidinol dehydrogenase [Brevibacterium sp. 91QC2O2]|uniref:histidinol dehydrogenase n=1 Tax=Brevibacterium TaxID=1696 RepID=UPI00211CD05A|nr:MULTISPECIES: histidinol dehydrogenase [unclassified Brevibacterium]MCQ9367009.1 histidinol dehydrogenase [Brevibacterium sp. 91QC2O2]MCQ9384158.1 histidinol dehydrogenase [Brevibacterium sp. 68QC2CO]